MGCTRWVHFVTGVGGSHRPLWFSFNKYFYSHKNTADRNISGRENLEVVLTESKAIVAGPANLRGRKLRLLVVYLFVTESSQLLWTLVINSVAVKSCLSDSVCNLLLFLFRYRRWSAGGGGTAELTVCWSDHRWSAGSCPQTSPVLFNHHQVCGFQTSSPVFYFLGLLW